jgi:four helix bundle protein
MGQGQPSPRKEGYRNLRTWQLAKEIALEVYQMTGSGPLARDFVLRDQMRRPAVSVPSNIAEGDERDPNRDCVRFLYIANGSLAELLTQLEIGRDVGLIGSDRHADIDAKLSQLGRMLGDLIRARSEPPSPLTHHP